MTDMEPENPGPLLKYMRSRNADLIEQLTAERDASNELGKALEEDAGQLRAERDRLRAALRDIARQKKTDEMDTEYDVEYADFEGGYNAIIDVARAALKGESLE